MTHRFLCFMGTLAEVMPLRITGLSKIEIDADEATNLESIISSWKTNRLQSVETFVNSQASNLPVNIALDSLVNYTDLTSNPMNEVTADGGETLEQMTQAIISSTVPFPGAIIGTMNERNDLIVTAFPAAGITFTNVEPELFNFTITSVGSDYSSYAQPGTQYSTVVK